MISTPAWLESPADISSLAITPESRIECLIAAAQSFLGVAEEGGQNHGQMVELFLREVGLAPGDPWCAAFVHHVGHWSQYEYWSQSSPWPLPATGSCAALGAFAARRSALSESPARGDVFLLYEPGVKRFGHTGIVLDVRETSGAYSCTTIEGNTNDDGSPEGWKTCLKMRHFSKGARHRFIRWTALLADTAARKAA